MSSNKTLDKVDIINAISAFEGTPPSKINIVETHISIIFISSKFVYKQKKSLNLGFVDYTSLEKRKYFARKELSLNRRSCSKVYIDILEIRQVKNKIQKFQLYNDNNKKNINSIFIGFKNGKIIDVLVRMRRIQENLFLNSILEQNDQHTAKSDNIKNTSSNIGANDDTFKQNGVLNNKTSDGLRQPLNDTFKQNDVLNNHHALTLTYKNKKYNFNIDTILRRIAKRVYLFHKNARASKRINSFGNINIYKENWDDNFYEVNKFFENYEKGRYRKYLKEIRDYYNNILNSEQFKDFVMARIKNRYIRDCHGDIRMEHIALIDLCRINGICIMDCVEFNEKFRMQDIYLDIAFLLMDFEYNGFYYESFKFFRNYKSFFSNELNNELYNLNDLKTINNKLLDINIRFNEFFVILFFKAYRALVRAKISILSNKYGEVLSYLKLCRSYARISKQHLIIMNIGLSGSGKTALSNLFADYFDAEVLTSDKIRKEVVGGKDVYLYDESVTKKVYDYILEQMEKLVKTGKNAILDATFLKKEFRLPFMKFFKKNTGNFIIVYSKIYSKIKDNDEQIILKRLNSRDKNTCGSNIRKLDLEINYSDADESVYFKQKKDFEPPSEDEMQSNMQIITVDASKELKDRFNYVLNRLFSIL